MYIYLKYLHASHIDTFHVNKIYVGSILISNVHSKIHVDSVVYLRGSDADFIGCFRRIVSAIQVEFDRSHKNISLFSVKTQLIFLNELLYINYQNNNHKGE